MNLIRNTIYGILIGIGAILPGISSGVICMAVGIYEKLITSTIDFFKDIKHNIKFLSPILIGSLIGILLFSNIVIYCFYSIPIQIKSLFIGLLLGSIYILYKNNAYRKSHISSISFMTCFIVGILLIFLEKFLLVSSSCSIEYDFFFLMMSGFFMSIGVVVPGVSSTVILMLLKVYDLYLNAVSTINLAVLIPIGIGLIMGSLLFLKIIKILFNKFNNPTIFGIVGFSLGSIFILYPGYSFNIESLIGFVLLILGFIIGKSIEKN